MPDSLNIDLENDFRNVYEFVDRDQKKQLSSWKTSYYLCQSALNSNEYGLLDINDMKTRYNDLTCKQVGINNLISDIYISIKNPELASYQWDYGREKKKLKKRQEAVIELKKAVDHAFIGLRNTLHSLNKKTELTEAISTHHRENNMSQNSDYPIITAKELKELKETIENLNLENSRLRKALDKKEQSEQTPLKTEKPDLTDQTKTDSTELDPFHFLYDQDEDAL